MPLPNASDVGSEQEGDVAWMRMMGAHSVAYHEHTVAGRGDDPVANALDYYASRGETPMSWGGSGAALPRPRR